MQICSLESKLLLITICSIRILNILEAIAKTSCSIFEKCLTLIQASLRRVSTTLIFLHALKYYYWLTNPSERTGIQSLVPAGIVRPSETELMSLRAYLLLFLKQLMQPSTLTGDDQYTPDEELNALTNFLLTVHEDKNILDVLQFRVKRFCVLTSKL